MHRYINAEAQIFMSSDTMTVVHRDDFVRLGRAWGDIVDTMFSVSFMINAWSILILHNFREWKITDTK